MVVGELLRTALYPQLVSIIVGFFLAGMLARSVKLKDMGVGLALAAGFVCGFLTIVGWVPMPPIQITHWLLWFAIGGFVVFTMINADNPRIGFWIGTVLFAAIPYLLLKPFYGRWDQTTSLLWVVGLTLGFFLLNLAVQVPQRKQKELAGFLILIVAATGASLVNVLDGGALNGQLGGVLAAACGGLFIVRCFSKEICIGPVTLGVFLALFGSLLILGYFYVEVAPYALILVALSPLALWLRNMPFLAVMGQTKRTVVLVVIAALPVLIAVATLAVKAANQDSGYGY